jgi:hypothetical protein
MKLHLTSALSFSATGFNSSGAHGALVYSSIRWDSKGRKREVEERGLVEKLVKEGWVVDVLLLSFVTGVAEHARAHIFSPRNSVSFNSLDRDAISFFCLDL